MKRAREWADELFGCAAGTADINDVRRIQADALRWSGNLSGAMHRVTIIQRAELLERLAAGSHSQADWDAEQQI